MTSTDIVLYRRWTKLWQGHPRAAAVHTELVRKYVGNGLPYHNLEHIRSCLELLDDFESSAVDKRAVEIALWFHDAIYDSKRKDNEAASAALAGELLTRLGLTGYERSHIMKLIMATKHDAPPATPDEKVIVDIDLAILGADADEYERYAAAIRKEYSWVAPSDYRSGRAGVLQKFLDRRDIYSTRKFQLEREARARANIATELAALQAP